MSEPAAPNRYATHEVVPRAGGSARWRFWLAVSAVVSLVLLLVVVWATDFVVMQNEWTIYTAKCEGGAWQGATCRGAMAAGERYRFRALKAHREVLYWTVGDSTGPSGRYEGCTVVDGRTWTCPLNEKAPRTITHEMRSGLPVADTAAGHLDFHRVPKWKYEALRFGLPVGGTATN